MAAGEKAPEGEDPGSQEIQAVWAWSTDFISYGVDRAVRVERRAYGWLPLVKGTAGQVSFGDSV